MVMMIGAEVVVVTVVEFDVRAVLVGERGTVQLAVVCKTFDQLVYLGDVVGNSTVLKGKSLVMLQPLEHHRYQIHEWNLPFFE